MQIKSRGLLGALAIVGVLMYACGCDKEALEILKERNCGVWRNGQPPVGGTVCGNVRRGYIPIKWHRSPLRR